uniref:MEMO1 family protein ENV67_06150 n=1 Tax=candidate division WOR-3 bacterium TaxID=2052148 RepID=A0A7C4Y5T2_UNCW3
MKNMFIFLLIIIGCKTKGEVMIRKPVVAGQFYPADPVELKKMVNSFLVDLNIEGDVIGFITPHAGYPFSGPTAGYSYSSIKGKGIKKVILIGPSHHSYFNGISIYDKGKWLTPLGEVEIDEELAKKIMKQNSRIRYIPEGHSYEHSLEVQIPFLQMVLKDFKIVPIVMGAQTEENVNILKDALVNALKDEKDFLLIASSDFYHGESYEEAKDINESASKYIEKFEPDSFFNFIIKEENKGIAAACGFGPSTVVMGVSKALGADTSLILHKTTSNDVMKVYSGYVVGYISAVFVKKNSSKFTLNDEEKKTLLNIARKTIEEYITSGKIPDFDVKDEKLKVMTGVFVTLKKKGELRGCIGLIKGIKPLYLGVRDMAIAAATEDPRFFPVRKDELKDIEIEISVLTPFQKVKDPEEIVVGKDGLYIVKGIYSGLLLPQVPVEWGWDRKTFLEQVCYKAGLPKDAWKNAELYKFQALVFSE